MNSGRPYSVLILPAITTPVKPDRSSPRTNLTYSLLNIFFIVLLNSYKYTHKSAHSATSCLSQWLPALPWPSREINLVQERN